jgi:DNA-binding transcriptional ArsR family regulator
MSTRKSPKRAAPGARAAPKPKPKPNPKLVPKVNIDHLFHALGDPTRRDLLDRLTHGPMSVSALADPLGITLTAVAQHLQILEECALVHTEKLGRVRTCRIAPAGFDALERWVKDHRTIWEQRLGRLGMLLDEPDAE